MTKKGSLFGSLGVLLLSLFALPAQAVTLDFFCITNNNAGDCAIGASQLSVDVSSYGANQVLFSFYNTGSDQSTISEIYFDDGTLLGVAGLIDADDGTGGDPNVDFTQGANPPDLPGGSSITPQFQVTAGFLADADNPAPKWGVSPGQTLGIVFDLQSGGTYSDVLTELGDGTLRVGLHVINYTSGGSESFVNNPLPAPAAVWLFGSGLLGLVAVARRKSKA